MAYLHNPLIVFLLLLALLSTSLSFKSDMIRRDSPHSPHYNPLITKFERVKEAVHRSFARQKSLSLASSNASRLFSSPIYSDVGEYLMKIFFGTQNFPIWAIIDTGSDLTWTQCLPCEACYYQYDIPYDPSNSTSYQLAPCNDTYCIDLSGFTYCGLDSRCNYLYRYGDGSYTAGNLATDTISFLSQDENVSFSGVYIGCGYANAGTFDPTGSGLVGLAGSPRSLISQMNVTKFSYCLPYIFSTNGSTITFGPNAEITGNGLVITPLVTSPDSPFYSLTILGFKVGSTEISSSQGNIRGNTIIDSGTTLTYLPSDLVDGIIAALTESIDCPQNTTFEQFFDLCYDIRGCKFTLPQIMVHLDGGDLELPEMNTFVEIDDGVKCLTIVRSNVIWIWGNIAQMFMKTEYDLGNRLLKFLPANCSDPN